MKIEDLYHWYHVVGSDSGAGWIKQSIKRQGAVADKLFVQERLINNVGPIRARISEAHYLQWLSSADPTLQRISGVMNGAQTEPMEAAWTGLIETKRQTVFWYSSLDMSELGFFISFLMMHPKPDRVLYIDVSNVKLEGRSLETTGELEADKLFEAWALRRRYERADIRDILGAYSHLICEEDGLRVFQDGHPIIASLDYFDPLILDALSTSWSQASVLMSKLYRDRSETTGRDIEYGYILWRLMKLSEAGMIEIDGSIEGGRLGETRLRRI